VALPIYAEQKNATGLKHSQVITSPSSNKPVQVKGDVAVQGNIQTSTQATVSVKELPPINTRRDWLDYSAVGVNLSLLFVGMFGVLYARRTLIAIRRQLVEIKRAGIQAHKMIDAAKQQAEASTASYIEARDTARLTQCADVLIDVIELENAYPHFQHSSRIRIVFRNYGPTLATNVKLDFTLQPGTLGDIPNLGGPIVIASQATAAIIYATFSELGWGPNLSDIQSGIILLKFKGTISYQDVFGYTHTTDCFGQYNPHTRSVNAKQTPLPTLPPETLSAVGKTPVSSSQAS